MSSGRGIFLDRDGLLNELVYYPDSQEWESPRTPEALCLIDGVLEALLEIQAKGWPLFLVSNQPSYAKGKASMEGLLAVHHHLETILMEGGIYHLAGSFCCFHHPDSALPAYRVDCTCRKPKPGLLLVAAEKHGLDLSQCWMIGDQASDIECGRRAGCRTVLVPNLRSEHKRQGAVPDFTISHLKEFNSLPLERTCSL